MSAASSASARTKSAWKKNACWKPGPACLPAAFEIPLEKFEISDRVYAVISETGLQTVGDLLLQMKLDPDAIWKLSGMGPKAMQELQTALDDAGGAAAAAARSRPSRPRGRS